MDTDIAVIEKQIEYDQWEIIAWVGFDRSGGELEDTQDRLRIRYLEEEE